MAFKNYYGNTLPTGGGSSDVVSAENIPALKDMKIYHATINSKDEWAIQGSSAYEFVTIPVNGGESYRFRQKGNEEVCVVYFLRTFTGSLFGTADYSGKVVFRDNQYVTGVVPDDCRYVAVWIKNTNKNTYPEDFVIDGINYANDSRMDFKALHYDTGVNVLMFGDSITEKYYSFFNADGSVTTRESGFGMTYADILAGMKSWHMKKMATGGVGWIVYSAQTTKPHVAFQKVRLVEDWSNVNLVTFAYGVNDWKGNARVGSLSDPFTYAEDMTPTTVIDSMRYCFEYIHRKNPYIKIVVITPLNCRGYSYDFGNESTVWARGYTGFANSGTLDEFANKMIECCEHYGVEVVDMTRASFLTNGNIVQALPDGVHPSRQAHEMIAIELCNKINFGL